MYIQSLAHTNPHWARVVGYGPFPLCVIHKEGLYPSSGDIDWLMMNGLLSTTTFKTIIVTDVNLSMPRPLIW
jgi:hypothetical protein